MFFASDNGGPVHPKVMEALVRANDGHRMPYGVCDWTEAATALIRETLASPEAEVRLVPTGTSANALALSTLTQPWRRVFCSDVAHVHTSEWGAVAFYSGGGELGLVPSEHGRMTAADLDRTILAEEEEGRRGPVTVTQVTEAGTVYDRDTLAALTGVAAAHGLPVHLDGARFANAVAALGCTPAEMVEGLTALSFGGTKNGCMGVEAVVLRDPAAGDSLAPRRYRGGHLFSKHRFLAAQMVGYLQDGLWLETAAEANRKCARMAQTLAGLPDVEFQHPPQANIIFARMPAALHSRLKAEGATYYIMEDGAPDDARPMCRLVCDWSIPDDAIARFLDLVTEGA